MNPKLQVYPWTGENSYFIQGNNESLAIGAGEYVIIIFLSVYFSNTTQFFKSLIDVCQQNNNLLIR